MRPTDIQILISQVDQRLNENLTLSKGEKKPEFSLELPFSPVPRKALSLLPLPVPEEPEVKSSKSQRRVRTASKRHGMYEGP